MERGRDGEGDAERESHQKCHVVVHAHTNQERSNNLCRNSRNSAKDGCARQANDGLPEHRQRHSHHRHANGRKNLNILEADGVCFGEHILEDGATRHARALISRGIKCQCHDEYPQDFGDKGRGLLCLRLLLRRP